MNNDLKALAICCAMACFISIVLAAGQMFNAYLKHELDVLKIEQICTHE